MSPEHSPLVIICVIGIAGCLLIAACMLIHRTIQKKRRTLGRLDDGKAAR